MRRVLLNLALAVGLTAGFLALSAQTPAHAPATARSKPSKCGVERWNVKTLGDSAAAHLSYKPKSTSVIALRGLAAPSLTGTTPRQPAERQAYRVNALFIGYKLEADRDIHTVVADPSDPKATMIVELPDSTCLGKAPPKIRKQIIAARAALVKQLGAPLPRFKRLKKPVPVTVTGMAFFDVLHGQTGVAPNGIELHPVFGLSFGSSGSNP